MLPWLDEVRQRLVEYASSRDRVITKQLGYGYDGIVYSTNCQSAIKGLRYQELYERERDVYLRLYNQNVFEVCGCQIPRLIDYDDRLWVVEMETVSPPFVLDFAGAYLDRKPDFPPDVLRTWQREKRAQFRDDWPRVLSIMAELARHGVHLADVKPGNITFR
jgi:hypothetical protein